MDSSDRPIDGFSIFGLILVVVIMVPVLHPIKLCLGTRLTRSLRRLAIRTRVLESNPADSNSSSAWYFTLDLTISPPLGVLILLITTTIDGSVIRTGILGEGDSKPYDVLVLFICLAYIATALDATGVLRSLAFYVSNQSNGSGPQLYLMLYCFFFIFGIIFGNDPIILSGTAFLAYFLKNCGITNPTAWIFMEFISSNIASAVLVSSNPTNVLLAQAFDLNFLTGFTKYTLLPSLASAIVGYILLYSTFRALSVPDSHLDLSPQLTTQQPLLSVSSFSPATLSKVILRPLKLIPRANYIPDRLNQPKVSPRSVLSDPAAAIFHGSLMLITLLLLVGTSFIKNVSVWQVTLPAGLLAFGRDLIYDVLYSKPKPAAQGETHAMKPVTHANSVQEAASQHGSETLDKHDEHRLSMASKGSIQSCMLSLERRLPVTATTVKKLPLALLPFAISMFVLIRSLGHLGWVRVWAGWAGELCSTPVRTVYLVGFLGSLVLCPFAGTNIGATILMVEILSHESFKTHPHIKDKPKTMQAAIFGAAMASNIGAFSLTIASSLAGLLWHQILAHKDILVSRRAFVGWNILPVLVLGTVAYSVVALEVVYLF